MENVLSSQSAGPMVRYDRFGWKERLFALVEPLVIRVPYVSELFNQGLSKSLSLLAGWHFVKRCGVEGDYLEFGVFRGEGFRTSLIAARRMFGGRKNFAGRFIAFDSFEGLPVVSSLKTENNIFLGGEYSASVDTFLRTLGSLKKIFPIEIVKGWFNRTLTAETISKFNLQRAAFINVDCDIYESTVDVLRFITPLVQTGTVLYFDDWFCQKGSMEDGEPKACQEWLAANPSITLVEYRNVGIYGKMFIVNRRGTTA